MLSLLTVNSLADVVAADGLITLREALQAANTNTAAYDAPAGSATETDVITFDESLFTDGTNPTPRTITLGGTQLEITDAAAGTDIQAPGAESLTIDANHGSRVLYVGTNVTAAIEGLTITGGAATGSGSAGLHDDDGGGIFVETGGVLNVTNCTSRGNVAAGQGGAIYTSGTLTLSSSLVEDNTASDGAGIYTKYGVLHMANTVVADNAAATRGGALYCTYATVDIVASSLVSNRANGSGNGRGGGVYCDHSDVSLINSTIALNIASTGGGAIYSYDANHLTATHCTIVENTVTSPDGVGGGIYDRFAFTVVANSIVAANQAASGPDIEGSLREGSGSNLVGIDPMLMTIADDAGTLRYYRPRPGSPAVDSGSNALSVDSFGNPLTTDMPGNARIVGSSVDIGAVEVSTTPELAIGPTCEVAMVEGEAVAIDVFLTAAPSATVSVNVAQLSGGASIAADPAVLEFDPANWSSPQTVTLSALDDPDLQNETAVYLFSAEGMDTVRVAVNATDNDGRTYLVNSLQDVVANDGFVTLREAIEAANTNADVCDALAGSANYPDVITFAPALAGGTIELSGTQLQCLDDLVIQGLGADHLTIDANRMSRVFFIGENTAATVRGLTITGGLPKDVDNTTDTDTVGGGIYNLGTLTVTNSTVCSNESKTDAGGGIYNRGTLSVVDSLVANNTADYGSAILNAEFADLSVTGSDVSSNIGTLAAIYNGGSMTVAGSSISNNSATGIHNHGTGSVSGSTIFANGGRGVYNSGGAYNEGAILLISNSVIAGHVGDSRGSGVCSSGGTLTIVGTTVRDNASRDSGGGVSGDDEAVVYIANSTIAANSADRYGGGLSWESTCEFTIVNSTIAGNEAGIAGGGIFSRGANRLMLANSVVAANVAPDGTDFGFETFSWRPENDFNLIGAWDEASPPGPHSVCGTTDTPLEPGLTAVTDESGSILHYRPFFDSPAVNAGSNILAVDADGNPLITDMLGNPRVYSSSVDIGAVELSAVPELAVTRTPAVDLTEGESFDVAVALTAVPAGTVSVAIAKAAGCSESIGVDRFVLEFNETNWGTPQIVTFSSLHDADVENESAAFAFSAGGMETVRIFVSAADDDGRTYVVNSLADVVATDGVVTLREAIQAANTNMSAGDAPAGSENYTDIITFAPELADGTIVLSGTQLQILDDLDIHGLGAERLAIDANGRNRVLYVAEGVEAAVSGLTITGGFAKAVAGDDYSDDGGGVLNRGTLTIAQSAIVGNATDGGYSYGGGICNVGSLDLLNSTVADNTATGIGLGYGGGISNGARTEGGTSRIVESIIADNASSYGGGGIYAGGSMTILNSSIMGNSTVYQGDGICVAGAVTIADSTIRANAGIGVWVGQYTAGTLSLVRSTIADNARSGLYNTVGNVTISDSTIVNNGECGVANAKIMVIEHSTISGNLYCGIHTTHTLTLRDSVVSENRGPTGGGIYSSGTTTISSSDIARNTAESDGGGICRQGGHLTLHNCTVADNTAGEKGGGICHSDEPGSLTVVNSTIAGNAAGDAAGGLYSRRTFSLANSIVAQNHAGVSGPDVLLDGVSLAPESDYNLIGVWDDAAVPGVNSLWGTSVAPLDPLLVAVDGDEGGVYYQPHYDSPAVDAGSDSLAVGPDGGPLATDMLGRPRIEGSAVDMGAVELLDAPQLLVSPATAVDLTEGEYAQIQVRLTAPPDRAVLVSVRQESEGGSGVTMAMIFDAANWDIPQTLTFAAMEDADRDNESVAFAFSADGMDTVLLPITVTDNDSQTYVVDSLLDVVAIDGMLTLREALEAAGTNTVVGDAPEGCEGFADVITFAPALFTDGTDPVPGAITLNGAQLEILDDVAIHGPDAGLLSIDANGLSRVLYVAPDVTASIDSLSIVGGSAQAVYPNHCGGGIYVDRCSELSLTQATVSGNRAASCGGGIYRHTMSTLVVADCTIRDNRADVDGAGVFSGWGGLTSVSNSTLVDNTAIDDGGGIYNSGDLTITDSTIEHNTAGWGGGVCHNFARLSIARSVITDNRAAADGGGLYNNDGVVTIADSTFAYNHGTERGGGLINEGTMTVTGSLLEYNSSKRGGGAYNGGPLTFIDSVVQNNQGTYGGGVFSRCVGNMYVADGSIIQKNSATYGGAIYNYETGHVTITNASILDNSASKGGGIYVDDDAWLTIDNSAVADNKASGTGGGIHADAESNVVITNARLLNNTAGASGGGVHSLGTVHCDACTFSANTANAMGGAIYNDTAGTATVAGSTFSDNLARNRGGAIYNLGTLQVDQTTFVDNTATTSGSFGGAVCSYDHATATIVDSVFQGNSAEFGGGVFGYQYATTTIANSALVGNSAKKWGGGLFNYGHSTLTAINLTVASNAAGQQGGGFYNYSDCTLVVANSIVALNSAPADPEVFGTLAPASSHNLLGVDPGFVRNPSDGGDGWGDDPATPDVDESANDDYGDLHLTVDSPAVNAGSNDLAVDAAGNPLAADLDGNPRFVSGTVDVGAYEYQGVFYAVNSLEDTVADDGLLTLREALLASNTNTALWDGQVPAGSDVAIDVITFDPALFVGDETASAAERFDDIALRLVGPTARPAVPDRSRLSVAAARPSDAPPRVGAQPETAELVARTITLGGTQLDILDDLEIRGPGAELLTIDAAGQSRVFYVGQDVDASIWGITLTGGWSARQFPSDPDDVAGGILNDGDLLLDHVAVCGNRGMYGAGGVWNRGTLTVADSTISDNIAVTSMGGGIRNTGVAQLTQVTLENNRAECGGGIANLGGTLTIVDSTVRGNRVMGYSPDLPGDWTTSGVGGGIYNSSGTLAITDSTIADNVSEFSGPWHGLFGEFGLGGGVHNSGTLTVTASTISTNTASRGGGGISNRGGTADISDSAISGNSAYDGGGVYSESHATITGSTLAGNTAVRNGGGIYSLATLTVANSTIVDSSAANGGGIHNDSGEVALSGSVVSGNSANYGGGILAYSGTVDVVASTISNNSAVGAGGGINGYGATLSITDSTMSGNSAGTGGALSHYGSPSDPVTIVHSAITDNRAVGDGNYGFGGGIHIYGMVPTLTIRGSVISGNSANLRGGGITGSGTLLVEDSTIQGNSGEYGGGIYWSSSKSTITISASTIVNNSATLDGGGLYCGSGEIAITDSTISGNSATRNGGGVYAYSGTITVANSTLSENTATASGGGAYSVGDLALVATTLSGNSATNSGGGVYSSGGLVVTAATLSRNTATGSGGGIHASGEMLSVVNSVFVANSAEANGGAILAENGNVTLTNSTVATNAAGSRGGGVYATGGTLAVANTILALNQAPTSADLYGILGPGSGAVLLGMDPGFVRNPSDGGDGWGDDPATAEVDESANDDFGDLRLRADSLAVNAGINALAVDAKGNPLATDLDGRQRIIYGTVDLGAYEFCLLCDVDYSGTVDGDDAKILASHWGMFGMTWSDGDLNGDGRVNAADAAILAANWGATFRPEADPLPAALHDAAMADQYGPAVDRAASELSVAGASLPPRSRTRPTARRSTNQTAQAIDLFMTVRHG